MKLTIIFKSLCNALDLEVQTFTTVTCIGKKSEGKSRLLLVQLPDLATKRQILSKSAQLRSKTTCRKVYVNPDLTRSECETQKLLRDELKARKDKGETDLIIRGNRIVKRRGNRNFGQESGSSSTMVTSPPPSNNHQPQSCLNLEYSTPAQNNFPSAQVISNSKLKAISLNCRSIRSQEKQASLEGLVHEHSPDVIIGCESQLDSLLSSDAEAVWAKLTFTRMTPFALFIDYPTLTLLH